MADALPSRASRNRARNTGWLEGALICALLVLVNVLQPSRKVSFDTKLDLVLDPLGFLGEATHMWIPDQQLGLIQNQGYGYLFPIGPFFALGDLVQAPDWLWQRLWSGIVLAVAFEGARRLARAAVPGADRLSWVAAGLAFALAPRLLGTVGVLSGESLPGAVLPWTVLPLVLAERGALRWSRASLFSAATVPLMGGHNATEVLLVLPLPALLLLAGSGTVRDHLLRLARWTGLVALGCAWWWLPLLLMGRYSPPFLDYIETAGNVTSGIGWFETLQGATHWVANASPAVTHWDGAHALVTSPLSVTAFWVLASVGLVGLCVEGVRLRPAFAAGLVGATLLLVAGHDGFAQTFLREPVLAALDGALAPFRNIHKLDPVVRLALALGLANSLAAVGRLSSVVGANRVPAGLRRLWPASVAVLLCLLAAAPAATLLRDDSGWSRIPDAWIGASRLVAAESGRALVVPGTGAAVQSWGRTVDEVMQTQPGVSFASYGQAPLAPPGTIRMLEQLDVLLQSGRRYPELGAALSSVGFTHVIVRSDVLEADEDSLRRIRATLAGDGTLRSVYSGGRATDGTALVEVYRLASQGGAVHAAALSGPSVSSGVDPGSGIVQRAMGRAPGDTVDVAAGRDNRVVTEGVMRRERAFGRLHEAVSHIRTRDEAFDLGRRQADYLPAGSETSVADLGSIRTVTTSSGASRADNFGAVEAPKGPWAALDGDPSTSWRSGTLLPGTGQWFEVAFSEPRALRSLAVQFGTFGVAVPTRVEVETEVGAVVRDVPINGRLDVLGLPSTPTATVRLTVLSTASDTRQVDITDLSFDGAAPERTVVVPTPLRPGDSAHFHASAGTRACFTTSGNVTCSQARASDEVDGMARRVTTVEAGEWELSGAVVSAPATDDPARLFRPIAAATTLRASSTFANDPLVNVTMAADGDPRTQWYSSPFDAAPALTFEWTRPRTLTEIVVRQGSRPLGAAPTSLVLEADGERRSVRLRDGRGTFAALTAREATVRLRGPAAGVGVSVGEIEFPGVDLGLAPTSRQAATGAICGFGPTVTVDGREIETRVEGTIADVLDGATLRLVPCTKGVTLKPGSHRISVGTEAGFQPVSLTLRPVRAEPFDPPQPVTLKARDSHRFSVLLAPGEETVLSLTQNANPGWGATHGNRSLRSVEVNGWQQAFVVPASNSQRVVEVAFGPDRTFRLALLVGALSALILVALVVRSLRRPGAPAHQARSSPVDPRSGATRALVVLVLAWLGGPVTGVAAVVGLGSRRSGSAIVAALALLAGALLAHALDARGTADGLTAAALGLLVPSLLGAVRR